MKAPFSRIRRRPDHWSSPHERARARSAERMDGPLGLAEATWLEEHLAECAQCAAVAASYEEGRAALHGLRDNAPEPPRDLWARTSAAIERESIARGRTPKPASGSGRRVPVGALSGLAVIAVVVGVSAVSSGLLGGGIPTPAIGSPEVGPSDTASTPGPVAATPGATPFLVGAGDVRWLSAADGKTAFNIGQIDQVCPVAESPDCAPLAEGDGSDLGIAERPTTVFGSPTREEAVVVTDDGAGRQRLIVVVLPTPEPTTSPEPTGPTESPEATPSPDPTTSAEPTESAEPTSSPEPTASAAPTEPPASSDPPSASPPPTESAPPSVDPSIVPSFEPDGESIGIPDGLVVDAGSAAFSPDGTWFAFTATPADDSTGPNVYVWQSGDIEARAITTDGRSVFASWADDQVVISRPLGRATPAESADPDASPSPGGEPGLALPASFMIDPLTAVERPVAGAIWRPVVDPLTLRAVSWVGSVAAAGSPPDTVEMPDGRLELIVWPGDAPDAGISELHQVVADGPLSDFDVRWDETGEWFAVWTPDPEDPTIGRLSLFRVDLATGELIVPDEGPAGVPALEGFSIGQGRLAWATPPGTDGEGSRILIAAWTQDGVGTLESDPGEDLIVVR